MRSLQLVCTEAEPFLQELLCPRRVNRFEYWVASVSKPRKGWLERKEKQPIFNPVGSSKQWTSEMGQVLSASKCTRGKKFALLVELLMSRLLLPFYGGAREEPMSTIPACSRGPSSAFVCDAS